MLCNYKSAAEAQCVARWGAGGRDHVGFTHVAAVTDTSVSVDTEVDDVLDTSID